MENENVYVSDELIGRLNRYYGKVYSDYEYYKQLYMEIVNRDKINIKVQTTYEYLKKQLDNLNYYFNAYLVKPENTENNEIDTEEYKF